MSIRDHLLLKGELLEAMTGRAITSTGDFDIFKLKLAAQWIIADEYFKGLNKYDKQCFMREVEIKEMALEDGGGVEDSVSAFQFDLSNILNKYIQEEYVQQMQPILDNYWEEQNYDG